MTSFKKGMVLGVVIGISGVILTGSLIVFNIYKTAKPGFVVDKSERIFSNKERQKTVEALVKLSNVYSFFGYKKLAITTIGSAGALMTSKDHSEKLAHGSHYLLKANDIAQEYAAEKQDYNPLLENYFHHALFLKDMGEIKSSLKKINIGIEVALNSAPESYWLENLKNAKKHIESLN